LRVAYNKPKQGNSRRAGRASAFPKDTGQAIDFATSACSLGSNDGCVRAAALKIQNGDAKDGLAQLRTLCDQKIVEACERVFGLYYSGLGSDVPANTVLFREYAQKACDLHSKKGCDALKLQGDEDSTRSSGARGNGGYEATCAAGTAMTIAMACAAVGADLLSGTGGSVDREKGMAMLRKACAEGYAPACKEVGGKGE
jgi:TPR repeat protein